jgi:hypothetical protein
MLRGWSDVFAMHRKSPLIQLRTHHINPAPNPLHPLEVTAASTMHLLQPGLRNGGPDAIRSLPLPL